MDTNNVYSENHKNHTNTLCGENPELLHVKAGGTNSTCYK
jgi:hypothetical protein